MLSPDGRAAGPPGVNPAQIHYAVRRLRRKLLRARIMVGLWTGLNTGQRDETKGELEAGRDGFDIACSSAPLNLSSSTSMVDSQDRLDAKATTGAQDIHA